MLVFTTARGGYCNLFCVKWRPKIPLWQMATYQQCRYPGRMTKNCWRSVDAHFEDGARRVLQSDLPMKEAKNSFMTGCNISVVWLPRTHDQKLLTLRWLSFSWWGRECVIIIFACEGGQYLDYVYPWPNEIFITRLTGPTFVDALLTLCLPWVYPQYVIVWFGFGHHSHCFGSVSSIFIYFHLDHYVVR